MKKVFVVIFILSTVLIFMFQNCSKRVTTTNYAQVDTSLQAYVSSFSDQALMRGMDLKISNLTLKMTDSISERKEMVGYCYREPILGSNGELIGAAPIILVKSDWWENSPQYKRMDLLYHEMGHCILGRPHFNVPSDKVSSFSAETVGVTQSIMKPVLLSTQVSEDLYMGSLDILLDELFFPNRSAVSSAKLGSRQLSSKSTQEIVPANELNDIEFFFSEDGSCGQE